jgi:predicted transcriptional regulator
VNGNQIRLLRWIVDRYDADEEPVVPAKAAAQFEGDIKTLCDSFDSLESNCLLAAVEGGYRPTITARELLELDIDDDTLVILDPEPGADESASQ